MKKQLIYFALLSINIACSNFQQDNEDIILPLMVQTKSLGVNDYSLTITTNLNENLVLFPSFYLFDGGERHEEITFNGRYIDTLSSGDRFWIMPYPVKHKKWVGIEGDYTYYDTSSNNDSNCPYFEGIINNKDLHIHLIYEDSIPQSGGNGGDKGKDQYEKPEDKPSDDKEPTLKLSLYYNRTYDIGYGWYELIFKIHSGIYTPEGIDTNPMYGEPLLVTYSLQGQMNVTTKLTPTSDYYVLKVQIEPQLSNKQIFVSVPDQTNEKFNYFIKGTSILLTLY